MENLLPNSERKMQSNSHTKISIPMDSPSLALKQAHRYQNVLVMRHSDRIDQLVELWMLSAARPWDPPLINAGRTRAFRTGVELRTRVGYPIHRVFVSPFLRCVETASEVVSALCAIGEDPDCTTFEPSAPIDPSKIKASIEYGLCEILNPVSVGMPPEDGDWGFNLSELELKLPVGTVDPRFEPVVQELPKWEEARSDGRARFERVIHALADRYPSENLLLITHGEGLRAVVSRFMNGTRIKNVEYCARVELQREITFNADDSHSAGKFVVISHCGYELREDGEHC